MGRPKGSKNLSTQNKTTQNKTTNKTNNKTTNKTGIENDMTAVKAQNATGSHTLNGESIQEQDRVGIAVSSKTSPKSSGGLTKEKSYPVCQRCHKSIIDTAPYNIKHYEVTGVAYYHSDNMLPKIQLCKDCVAELCNVVETWYFKYPDAEGRFQK